MLGVILWNDPDTHRAVIWCEDHGQLAFYRPDLAQVQDVPDVTVGDLVEFELRQDKTLRYAHDLVLVSGKHYKDIAENLVPAAQSLSERCPKASVYQANPEPVGNVIEFRKIVVAPKGFAVA